MSTDRHTTHFDDCGCLSARLTVERDALKADVAGWQKWATDHADDASNQAAGAREQRARAEAAEAECNALRADLATAEKWAAGVVDHARAAERQFATIRSFWRNYETSDLSDDAMELWQGLGGVIRALGVVKQPEPAEKLCPNFKRHDAHDWRAPLSGDVRCPGIWSPSLGEPVKEVIHKAPRLGEGVTACCGKTPFELPRTDRLTRHAQLANCPAPAGEPAKPFVDGFGNRWSATGGPS